LEARDHFFELREIRIGGSGGKHRNK
jgi:hypothetical protein